MLVIIPAGSLEASWYEQGDDPYGLASRSQTTATMTIGQIKVWIYPDTAVRVDIRVTGTCKNDECAYA